LELQLSENIARVLGPELRGLAWLLTYSIHALIWAVAVWLMTTWSPLSAAMRHTAWKVALLAPILTTLVVLGPWPLAAERSATSRTSHATLLGLRDTPYDPPPASAPSSHFQVEASSARQLGRGLDCFGAAALGASAFGVLRFGLCAALLRRRLRHRQKLERGRLLELLRDVRPRFALGPIKLSQSAEIDSPLVLGSAEICVPQRSLSELSDVEIAAVFAHELAHLERGDGFWFPAVGLLESVLWLHPVTRWVAARFRESAELSCDERCVQLTGEPRALALALTRLASQIATTRRALVLPTMTHPRSSLVTRVARLTSDSASGALTPRQGRKRLMLGLMLVAVASVGLHTRVSNAGATKTRPFARPGLAELSQEMNALAARRRQLELELQGLSRSADNRASEPQAAARALEIEQELRHALEMQQWLERRLVNE